MKTKQYNTGQMFTTHQHAQTKLKPSVKVEHLAHVTAASFSMERNIHHDIHVPVVTFTAGSRICEEPNFSMRGRPVLSVETWFSHRSSCSDAARVGWHSIPKQVTS